MNDTKPPQLPGQSTQTDWLRWLILAVAPVAGGFAGFLFPWIVSRLVDDSTALLFRNDAAQYLLTLLGVIIGVQASAIIQIRGDLARHESTINRTVATRCDEAITQSLASFMFSSDSLDRVASSRLLKAARSLDGVFINHAERSPRITRLASKCIADAIDRMVGSIYDTGVAMTPHERAALYTELCRDGKRIEYIVRFPVHPSRQWSSTFKQFLEGQSNAKDGEYSMHCILLWDHDSNTQADKDTIDAMRAYLNKLGIQCYQGDPNFISGSGLACHDRSTDYLVVDGWLCCCISLPQTRDFNRDSVQVALKDLSMRENAQLKLFIDATRRSAREYPPIAT